MKLINISATAVDTPVKSGGNKDYFPKKSNTYSKENSWNIKEIEERSSMENV